MNRFSRAALTAAAAIVLASAASLAGRADDAATIHLRGASGPVKVAAGGAAPEVRAATPAPASTPAAAFALDWNGGDALQTRTAAAQLGGPLGFGGDAAAHGLPHGETLYTTLVWSGRAHVSLFTDAQRLSIIGQRDLTGVAAGARLKLAF